MNGIQEGCATSDSYRERERLSILNAYNAAVASHDFHEREAEHQARLADQYAEQYDAWGFEWPEQD